MKTDICIWVSPGDRHRLERLVSDRNTPQKHVWRARIVLLSGDRLGTMAIMGEVVLELERDVKRQVGHQI